MTLGRDHANDGNRSTLIGMSERIGVRHFAANAPGIGVPSRSATRELRFWLSGLVLLVVRFR